MLSSEKIQPSAPCLAPKNRGELRVPHRETWKTLDFVAVHNRSSRGAGPALAEAKSLKIDRDLFHTKWDAFAHRHWLWGSRRWWTAYWVFFPHVPHPNDPDTRFTLGRHNEIDWKQPKSMLSSLYGILCTSLMAPGLSNVISRWPIRRSDRQFRLQQKINYLTDFFLIRR